MCHQENNVPLILLIPVGPIYTKRQRQRCDDACDSVLTENNRVAPEWVCNLFSSGSTVFKENRIASVIAVLMLMLGVNGPLYSCWFFFGADLRGDTNRFWKGILPTPSPFLKIGSCTAELVFELPI